MDNATPDYPLDDITLDARLQPRETLSADVIEDYAARYAEGDPMPPVRLVSDGQTTWLADGFHRYHAARSAGHDTINAEVLGGQFRDALLIAGGANAAHGLRRTNADKRRAVEMLLGDADRATWPDREIARHCSVDHKTVSAARSGIWGNSPDEGSAHPGKSPDALPADPATRTVTRGGVTYQMNTGNIGKRPASGPGPRGREMMRPWPAASAKVNAHGLLPCPFCGTSDVVLHREDPESDTCAICRTRECNVVGPRFRDKDAARDAWNRRV